MGEKMKEYYQKNLEEKILVEAKPHMNYKKELTQQDKENIFKEIYSCIDLFRKLAYE